MGTEELKLDGVTVGYGKTAVFRDLSVSFSAGKLTTILGPSGCGKSTLLLTVAGLLSPREGRVFLGSRDITEVEPGKRNVAFVFQSYALYPHLSVFENIAFPLRVARKATAEIKQQVQATAELLGIAELLPRWPRELSGGQRQRVAVGRALVREPTLLLLDEPLSNLDAQLRLHMRREIKALQRRFGLTTLYVTHDQAEALTLGDRVLVLKDGEVQQYAQPADLLTHPANVFVASFVGSPPANIASAALRRSEEGWRLTIGEREYALDIGAWRWREGWPREGEVTFSIPARSCVLGRRNEDGWVRLKGEVTLVEDLGGEYLVSVEVADAGWTVAAGSPPALGEELSVSLPLGDVRFYDPTNRLAVVE